MGILNEGKKGFKSSNILNKKDYYGVLGVGKSSS
jgi:hypothetical protein